MLYHKWGWEAALSGVGRWKGIGKHGLISPTFLNCFQRRPAPPWVQGRCLLDAHCVVGALTETSLAALLREEPAVLQMLESPKDTRATSRGRWVSVLPAWDYRP